MQNSNISFRQLSCLVLFKLLSPALMICHCTNRYVRKCVAIIFPLLFRMEELMVTEMPLVSNNITVAHNAEAFQ